MNIEQERAQFEAWYRLHHGSLNVYGRDASGEYADKQVQGAFNVWQARAALTAQPVAWVAADTLNSPHPACVSSLAYMSQLDRERGREYVPLYAAPVAAQTADDADPLQGAADWLVKALAKPRTTEIAARLLIGYNRAERLFDAAMQRTSRGEE